MSVSPASSLTITPSTPFVNTTLYYGIQLPTTPPEERWYTETLNNINNKNFDYTGFPSKIYDLRGQEDLTHIDSTGFQVMTSPSSVSADFILTSSDAEVQRLYYPEVEALLKKKTGASRVAFFGHVIRRPPTAEKSYRTQPVLRTHVDNTPASAHWRVERHVQPPHPYKRFQVINVWRPILNKVYDYPLAACDCSTVDVVKDLTPVTLINPPPTPNGETYAVKYSDKHRWWYLSEMTPDDVVFLKCYDSASRVMTQVKVSAAEVMESELRDIAGVAPHTAFYDEEGAKKGIGRHSIEVRTLVFYD